LAFGLLFALRARKWHAPLAPPRGTFFGTFFGIFLVGHSIGSDDGSNAPHRFAIDEYHSTGTAPTPAMATSYFLSGWATTQCCVPDNGDPANPPEFPSKLACSAG
jgi:hypothetical protein